MKRNVILILILLASFSTLFGQKQNNSFPLTAKTIVKNANCETNIGELGILNQYTKKAIPIIIISHAGKTEKNGFGKRRLHNAKSFLTKGFTDDYNRVPESIVTAEAEEVSGNGYLDFYVAGNLELRIMAQNNQDLSVGQCVINYPYEEPCSTDFDKLFYPCKSKKHNKKTSAS